jgi:hypothetical protein
MRTYVGRGQRIAVCARFRHSIDSMIPRPGTTNMLENTVRLGSLRGVIMTDGSLSLNDFSVSLMYARVNAYVYVVRDLATLTHNRTSKTGMASRAYITHMHVAARSSSVLSVKSRRQCKVAEFDCRVTYVANARFSLYSNVCTLQTAQTMQEGTMCVHVRFK